MPENAETSRIKIKIGQVKASDERSLQCAILCSALPRDGEFGDLSEGILKSGGPNGGHLKGVI